MDIIDNITGTGVGTVGLMLGGGHPGLLVVPVENSVSGVGDSAGGLTLTTGRLGLLGGPTDGHPGLLGITAEPSAMLHSS